LIPFVNRERIAILAIAAIAATCGAPAIAKDPPKPSLSIDPIVAPNLLAPVDEDRSLNRYRLDPGREPASGQQAKLSIDLGKATMFAITGRLQRQPAPAGPLDSGHARALGPKREGGKVYGAGVAGSFHGVDLSATYQYSKLRAEQGETDAADNGPGRSHSLRATARIRFRR